MTLLVRGGTVVGPVSAQPMDVLVDGDRVVALLAPGGTPRPILEKLNKEMTAALNDPGVRKGFETAGAVTLALPLDTAKKFHADEIVKYRDIIAKAGIQQIQ